MIRTEKLTVTTSGSNGNATGSGQTGVISGRILAVHIDFTSEPNTTDVTIATAHAPILTFLTITSSNTDAWYYPRAQVHGLTGTALTFDGTRTVNEPVPVDDHISVTVAEGDNAGTVAVTILYEC